MMTTLENTKKARRTFSQLSTLFIVFSLFSANCFATKVKFYKISASKISQDIKASVNQENFIANFGKAKIELAFKDQKLADQLEQIKFESSHMDKDYVLSGYFKLKNKKTVFVTTNIRFKVPKVLN